VAIEKGATAIYHTRFSGHKSSKSAFGNEACLSRSDLAWQGGWASYKKLYSTIAFKSASRISE